MRVTAIGSVSQNTTTNRVCKIIIILIFQQLSLQIFSFTTSGK